MKNKLQEKIGAIINNIKLSIIKKFNNLHLFLVSWQFGKDVTTKDEIYGDWYNNHSWFEKDYFLSKLKRKFMGFIYRIGSKINDLTCEKYYYEFVFGDMFCRAIMPIIFYVNNYEDVEIAIGQINGDLVEKFRFTLLPTNNVKKIENGTLKLRENQLRNNNTISYGGSINLATRFGKTKESTILDYLNVDKDNVLLGNFIETNTKIDFTIIKDNNNYLRQLDNSTIIITIINNELCNKAINIGFGSIDRMKEIIKHTRKPTR